MFDFRLKFCYYVKCFIVVYCLFLSLDERGLDFMRSKRPKSETCILQTGKMAIYHNKNGVECQWKRTEYVLLLTATVCV